MNRIKNYIILILLAAACNSNKTAEQFFNDGQEHLKAGEHKEAKQAFESAILKNPSFIKAMIFKATAERNLKEYEAALLDLNKALEIDTSSALAFTERAFVKLSLMDNYGALNDCNKALSINPELPSAYKCRAKTKALKQDIKGAISDYGLAIKYNPKDTEAYFENGKMKLELGYTAAACQDFSKAGELGLMDAYEMIKENCNNLENNEQTTEKKKINLSNTNNQLTQKRESKETWILKKSSTGKFNILFSTNPSYSKDGAMDRWLAKDKDGEVIYRIATTEGSSPAPSNPKYQLETNLLPSLIGSDILLTKNFTKYQGYDALDFIYKSSTDKNGLYIKGRAILAGKRAYVLLTQYYHSDLVDFDKFANSLTIL